MEGKNMFVIAERPVPTWKMTRELCAWFALGLYPEDFDCDTCCDIIGNYHKYVKIQKKDKEECLSVKQYKVLYTIYKTFRIEDVFKKFNETHKWVCISLKKMTLEKPVICSETEELINTTYFEVLDKGILCSQLFETLYKNELNHKNYKLEEPTTDENLITDETDFE
tara:strand:- start:943 stop:1443 length:501 start_codon:yes stop_codon:yes gene_type:complete